MAINKVVVNIQQLQLLPGFGSASHASENEVLKFYQPVLQLSVFYLRVKTEKAQKAPHFRPHENMMLSLVEQRLS